jgi:hypothetical protein
MESLATGAVAAQEILEKPPVPGAGEMNLSAMPCAGHPDIGRADISISRRVGGVCRRMRLTKRASMTDIAADFDFSD